MTRPTDTDTTRPPAAAAAFGSAPASEAITVPERLTRGAVMLSPSTGAPTPVRPSWWKRSRRAIAKWTALVLAGGALGTAGTFVGIHVAHGDAVKQTEAANRQALCPDALQARRTAQQARRDLDPDTGRTVRWCLEPVPPAP